MNTRMRGIVCLVAAAALFLCVPLPADAAPRKPAPAPKALQTYAAASVDAEPIPASPFYLDLDNSQEWQQTYRVSLDAGQRFALILAATELDIHAGLLPPTATSITDDFVAWGNGDVATVSYLDYVAPVSGDYTLMVFYGAFEPDSGNAHSAGVYVTWEETPGSEKSNIPGVLLPPGGATGTLDSLTNASEVHRVALAEGEGLHLRLEPGGGSGDIDLDVFQPGWSDVYRAPAADEEPVVARSHGSAGFPEVLDFRAPATGDYYPRASLWGGREPMGYTLTYRITPPTGITAAVSTIAREYETPVISPALIDYGRGLRVSGLLTEDGVPLCGQIVSLSTYQSGEWNTAAWSESTTSTTYPGGAPVWWKVGAPFDLGSFAFDIYPTTNTRLSAWYPGVYWQHTSADSDTHDVMVKAYMSNLSAPTTVYRSHTFTASGIIKPKHASGTACPILLKVERRRPNGSYYVYKTVKTRGYGYSGYTKYVAKISLPYTGTWRIRGYHPENPITAANGNAASYSSYRTVKVR